MGTMVDIFDKSHRFHSYLCCYVGLGKSHVSFPLHITCLIFSCWGSRRFVEYITLGDAIQRGYVH